MKTEVELFRTDDYTPADRVALGPLLRGVFEQLIGQSLEQCRFELWFLPVADLGELGGSPSMVNLRASHGWVNIRILRDGKVLYQHPHAVREIIAAPLQRLVVEREPECLHWGFGVLVPGLDVLPLVRPAPQAANQVGLEFGARRRPRRFHVEEIPDPEPPAATLAELGVDTDLREPGSPLGVVIDLTTYDALTRRIPFSTEVEEGGFLTGRVYRTTGTADGYLVKVSAAVPAERTGASLMHFTFTGESFLRMGDRLASRGDEEQLVGWYHTHLFAATEWLGLSSIDVELHTSTFRKPSQVAGLVNLDGGQRVLRFYRTEGAGMEPAPYWVTRR